MLKSQAHIVVYALLVHSFTACVSSHDNQDSTSTVSGPCAGMADGTSCSDGDACTSGDACASGFCVGTAVQCGANTGCTVSACDPNTGACVQQTLDSMCSTSLTAVPMLGCSFSDYTVPVTVGSQTFQLTFDSGSSTLALAGSNCSNCDGGAAGTITPKYSGGTDTGKVTSAEYGGGEGWDGNVITDTVVVGSAAGVSMAVASIYAETIQSNGALPFFSPSYCDGSVQGETNDDQGIFGVGGTHAAARYTDAYMVKLQSTATPPVFATRMCDTNGFVWFGGYDPTQFTGAPSYTPLTNANDYYVVTLNDVRMGGVSLNLKASSFGIETIMDTGTSIVIMPQSAYKAVTGALLSNAQFKSVVGTDPNFFNSGNSCLGSKQSAAEIDKQLPRLQFVFAGNAAGESVVVDLPATESYLTPIYYGSEDPSSVLYCPALANWGSAPNPITIIGNSLMHSHVVIFDRQNMQIGFAPQVGCQRIGD